jgi:hypothetical protein
MGATALPFIHKYTKELWSNYARVPQLVSTKELWSNYAKVPQLVSTKNIIINLEGLNFKFIIFLYLFKCESKR